MADTDSYQPDAAGSAALDQAKQSTADQAAKQTEQNKAGVANAVKAGDDAVAAKQAGAQKAGASEVAKAAYKPGSAEPAAGSVATVLGGAKKGMDKVPETGAYGLTKGETVLPAKRASEYRKVFESRGAAGKHKWSGK